MTDTRTMPEPPPGSVILVNGETGTALQRFYSDGLWHRAGSVGGTKWEDIKTTQPILVVHLTEEEPLKPWEVAQEAYDALPQPDFKDRSSVQAYRRRETEIGTAFFDALRAAYLPDAPIPAHNKAIEMAWAEHNPEGYRAVEQAYRGYADLILLTYKSKG